MSVNKIKRFFTTFLFMFFLLSILKVAWGDTYYVDVDATDCTDPDNDYAPATQSCGAGSDTVYDTIQGLIDGINLGANDIVEVRAATVGGSKTYTGGVAPGNDDDGTSGNPVIYRGRSGDTITLDSGAIAAVITMWDDYYITFDNFIVDGTNATGQCVKVADPIEITFQNMTLQSGPEGIQIAVVNTNSDITFDTVQANSNTGDGFDIHNWDNPTNLLTVDIDDCSASSNSGAGLSINGDISGTVDNFTSIGNATAGSNWGIFLKGWSSELKAGAFWSAVDGNNESYFELTGDGVTPVEAVASNIDAYGFFSEGTAVGSLDPGEYKVDVASSPDRVYVDLAGVDPDDQTMYLIYRWTGVITCTGLTSTTTANPSGIEGVGIGFEKGVLNSIIQKSVSYNNGDANGGFGFISMVNQGCSFRQCIAYDNNSGGFASRSVTGQVIHNCIAYNNDQSDNNGGVWAYSFGTTTITNSIFNDNAYGIRRADDDHVITHTYNSCEGNSIANWSGTDMASGGTDVTADPLFVDAASDDFHILCNSPCKDAGTDVSLTSDYDGNAIPQGVGYDMGAYEALCAAAKIVGKGMKLGIDVGIQ